MNCNFHAQIAFLEGENERLNEELNAIRRAEDDTDGLPVILSRRVDDRKGNDGASLSGATLTEHLDHCQLLADDEDVAAITTTVDADDQVGFLSHIEDFVDRDKLH